MYAVSCGSVARVFREGNNRQGFDERTDAAMQAIPWAAVMTVQEVFLNRNQTNVGSLFLIS
jgi:hypothetical protein